MKKLNLTKSYRSSFQITNLANSILNRTDCDPIKRVGVEPELVKIQTKAQLAKKVKTLLNSYKQQGYNNVGIITKTSKNSRELFELLKDDVE